MWQNMSLSLLFLKRAAHACSLLLKRQWKPVLASLLLTIPAVTFAQGYARQAGEFPATIPLAGDQIYPQVSVRSGGGYIVWQDNFTDGDGLGISARRLDSNLSGVLSTFRVNQNGAGDQENARVAILSNGGAAFVWQGGRHGTQNIFARFLSSSNVWITGDIQVNTFTNSGRLNPALAPLANGNVIVVWASVNQASASSMQDVYGQLLSSTGQKIGSEFLINQFTAFHQRSPTVAGLANGGFVVAWVSEQQRSGNIDANSSETYVGYTSITNRPSVDIYARLFSASASPLSAEFLVSGNGNTCANPRLAAASDGTFMAVWSQKDLQNRNNSWDIFGRPFSSTGAGGPLGTVNATLYGDQVGPQIAVQGTDYFVAWTSLGQDGSREGVFGRFLKGDGSPNGNEFLINTVTVSRQIHPAVAADGNGRFLAVWTSFTGVANGFDLFAQRYASTAQPLTALAPPFVNVLSSNSLALSWAPLAGFNVSHYEVYMDGAATSTAVVTNSWWTMTGLAPSSTHWFQIDYVLADGRRSPLSSPVTNTTYSTLTWGGIPYDWMTRYFGTDAFNWPAPSADSDSDGVSNYNEYLAGTDPTSAASVWKVRLESTPQGVFLHWNTQPGSIYQVQSSTDLKHWTNTGDPRWAAGSVDSMYVGGSNAKYYRGLLLR